MPRGIDRVAFAEAEHRPLHMWNNSVQETTFLKRKRDILPAYKLLVESMDKNFYDQKLSKDLSLFIKERKPKKLE